MKRHLWIGISLVLALIVAGLFFATSRITLATTPQATAVVEVTSNRFSPTPLEIDQGDTVQWNNGQGFHNVVADDGSFTSGDPRGGTWTFTQTFNISGTYLYYCAVHGGPGGIGMAGQVVVREEARNDSDVIYLPIVER